MQMHISVAAIAPRWTAAGKTYLVGLKNKRGTGISAFGGGVALTDDEMVALRELGAEPEPGRGNDARLWLDSGSADAVMSWFSNFSPSRASLDLERELREELIEEGAPIIEEAELDRLFLRYDRSRIPEIPEVQLQLIGKTKGQITFLWFEFTIHTDEEVIERLRRSDRVFFPTSDDLANRRIGDLYIADTLFS